MKSTADAILRPDQATYLDALHSNAVRALAVLGGALAVGGRDPLLARMEARAAERGYPISDPEVACLLSVIARAVARRKGWPIRHPSPKNSPGLMTPTTASLPCSDATTILILPF